MTKLTVILCIIVFLAFWGLITYQSIKGYFKEKKKNKKLETDIENHKKNLIYIIRHSQELADIETARSKVDKDIKEAKSDEEVINIINTIIDTNNNRLHNNESK